MALVTLSGVRKTFRRGRSPVHAVNGVDLHIEAGETLALIGESGSGKSTVGRLALGLIQPDEGHVTVDGMQLDGLDRKTLQAARQNMTIVFQEPFQSLDPLMSVGRIIEEPLVIHEPSLTPTERRERVTDTMQRVILDPGLYERRPRELSGGQQQRVGVARAIVTGPKFVVLDEPTSSLDLSVQAGILELLANLQRDLGLAYLFISHDIGTVDYFSDRVAVMYLGQVVETGPKAAVLDTPRHPYTEALLSAALPADPTEQPPHIALTGDIPSPTQLPEGCFFYSRCNYRGDPRCATENPPLRQVGPDHWAATFCNVGGTAEPA